MMAELPQYALSVRQPWAWAIIHGGKDFENRCWKASNPGLRFRGRAAIHASKGMTRDEYEGAAHFMSRIGVKCPAAIDLERGGIIGSVEFGEPVALSSSPWFSGPVGLKLIDPRAHDFIPSVGALGFFRWAVADASAVPAPARWMRLEGRG